MQAGTDRPAGWQAGRQADRQAGSQTDGRTDAHTDKKVAGVQECSNILCCTRSQADEYFFLKFYYASAHVT
ncbi:hypothetical protein DPMN_111308 [Dreissena polymorpha]|uniref:Uncharacterized protein n=1 Tax=Dreissena polymorpha TaxID=45954 RepID=A0A9D4KE19_DREPO|nr:hypothetical protein DPMN_111308 [Dreissena polymorpha]